MKLLLCSILFAVISCGQQTITSSGSVPILNSVTSSSNLTWSGGSGAMLLAGDSVCVDTNGVRWACGTMTTPTAAAPPRNYRHWKLAEVKAAAKSADAKLIPATYLKHAEEIGLESPATENAKMLVALQKLGVKIYNEQSVSEYLYGKVREMKDANMIWTWRPMRLADYQAFTKANMRPAIGNAYGGSYVWTQYQKAIPERVVELAALVLKELPEANFIISDYDRKNPDPFMAVTTPGMASVGQLYVIAVWDEPAYTEFPSMQMSPI